MMEMAKALASVTLILAGALVFAVSPLVVSTVPQALACIVIIPALFAAGMSMFP